MEPTPSTRIGTPCFSGDRIQPLCAGGIAGAVEAMSAASGV